MNNKATTSILAHQVIPGDRLANTAIPVAAVTAQNIDGKAMVRYDFRYGVPPIMRPMFSNVEVYLSRL